MTNLDSIFKSRDTTLPTKVCLVKAIVFPVVKYGCEVCSFDLHISKSLQMVIAVMKLKDAYSLEGKL